MNTMIKMSVLLATVISVHVVHAQDTVSDDASWYEFWEGTWYQLQGEDIDFNGSSFHVRKGVHESVYHEKWHLVIDSATTVRASGLRAWDSASRAWHYTWISDDGLYQNWEGRKVDDVWYIYKTFNINGETILSRQAWVPISEDKLRRSSEWSKDSGQNWQLRFEEFYQRVSSVKDLATSKVGQWVDLTHNFDEQSIYWPTAASFKKTTVFEGHTHKGYYYSAYNYSADEHGGTHLDSPIHFYEGRHTVDEIPLDRLIGPAVVIRVHEQAAANRNYQFAVSDIKDWEAHNGKIPEGSILLIDTGSSKHWPDRDAYMGTSLRGEEGVKALQFPGIHPDAAKFMVSQRNIKAVGLDTPSIDFGGSTHYESHQILFEHNIPGFENVANLDQIPETGATVIALPMKIKGGSGAPLRIVAWIPE